MKILDSHGKLLILTGCVIENVIGNKDYCYLKFYGGSGTFGSDFTRFRINKSYEEINKFLLSDEKVLFCTFYTDRPIE